MNERTFRDREILSAAQERGRGATLLSFFRLSGPGWLQSAITLGGGSLGGALYLGVIGGNSMLWLQVVAIIIGVIMLSAISYVTLSTGKRPYAAINDHVNPVLGVSWITATILANMIFILPQFSLCYDVLDKNFGFAPWLTSLFSGSEPDADALASATLYSKIAISSMLSLLAFVIVLLSFKPGWASKMFDWLLKGLVGAIVICFVVAVVYLTRQNEINWSEALMGLIPDFSQWWNPAPKISQMMEGLDEGTAKFWNDALIERQRNVMITTTATAVGINMTFLLPYSMLARGWDKTFRGLARWDLITGMAIPFIIVTSCIVLASANAFHGKIDIDFSSDDPAIVQQSRLFKAAKSTFKERLLNENKLAFESLVSVPASDETATAAKATAENDIIASFIAKLDPNERTLGATLAKPTTADLARTLEPALGNKANLVFGLGVLGMGFSTIIILMLINGYALAEIVGKPGNNLVRTLGALAAVVCGFAWFWIWTGDSKTYLVVIASSFAAILLPIAYITFMALMNNRSLLGDEKPTGARMAIWNVLMTIGVIGAVAQSLLAISLRIDSPEGPYVIGGVITFLILALVGFSARPRPEPTETESA